MLPKQKVSAVHVAALEPDKACCSPWICEADTHCGADPAKKVGRDGLMEPKYRAVSKGQFLENFYWAQARKQKGQRKSKMGGDFVF